MARRKALPKVSLSDDYLKCRTIGHAWDEADNLFPRPPAFGTGYDIRCVRCGMVARDIVSRYTGERLASRRYVAPPGYRHAKGELPDRNTLKAVALYRRESRSASA